MDDDGQIHPGCFVSGVVSTFAGGLAGFVVVRVVGWLFYGWSNRVMNADNFGAYDLWFFSTVGILGGALAGLIAAANLSRRSAKSTNTRKASETME